MNRSSAALSNTATKTTQHNHLSQAQSTITSSTTKRLKRLLYNNWVIVHCSIQHQPLTVWPHGLWFYIAPLKFCTAVFVNADVLASHLQVLWRTLGSRVVKISDTLHKCIHTIKPAIYLWYFSGVDREICKMSQAKLLV